MAAAQCRELGVFDVQLDEGAGGQPLVAGDLENPFYPVAAAELSQAIHAAGRRLILHTVPPDMDVAELLDGIDL